MNEYWISLSCNFMTSAASMLLCVIIVREQLRKTLAQTIGLALGCLLPVEAALTFLPSEAQNLLLPLYLFAAYRLFLRMVDSSPSKMLFLLMVSANYACFIVGNYQALKIKTVWVLPLVNLLLILVSFIPVMLVLRRLLWPALHDLDEYAWRHLWIFPAFFSAAIIVASLLLEDAPRGVHLTVRVVLMIYSLLMYLFVLAMIRKTVAQTRKIEREQAAQTYLSLQGVQYQALMESVEQAIIARHDMRHQLAVISRYLHSGDIDGARAYCDKLTVAIPAVSDHIHCENFIINNLIDYYLKIAETENIRTSLRLVIPQKTGRIADFDLCVIIGNMLENAIEACRRIPPDERFLEMKSHIQYKNLVITLDNSFDGEFLQIGGAALSRKSNSVGVGLPSIRTAAEKYHGFARFEAKDNRVFLSSVTLQM